MNDQLIDTINYQLLISLYLLCFKESWGEGRAAVRGKGGRMNYDLSLSISSLTSPLSPWQALVILSHLPQLIIPSFITLTLHLVVPYLVMLLLCMSFWLSLFYHPIGTKMSPPKRDCMAKYYLSVLFCKYPVYCPPFPFSNLFFQRCLMLFEHKLS